MDGEYDHKEIEKKWQAEWESGGTYRTTESEGKPKAFVLDMFPYISGAGLHVGHPKGYIATDVYSRMKRMQGFNVLHPMGWDAFGLPAENYAIKTKTKPQVAVAKNVAWFKEQLQMIGFDYDWDREVNTSDPNFYKWTQWIFLKLLEKGLAFRAYAPVNWCPKDQTVLANEDVEADGTCERCGTKVEKRLMRQWALKITDYADRLLDDLELLPRWQENIKEMQRNWIGRSEGAEISFELYFENEKLNDNRGPNGEKAALSVFTTRPDTLYGATYMVLAPEHLWVTLALDKDHAGVLQNADEVRAYVEAAKDKTEIERTAEGKEKSGVQLKGVWAINPATKERIPMYVADYALAHYGTGAVMAVPAHDERDAQFAKKYNLPVKQIELEDSHAMVEQFGKAVTKYRLQDWVFSRQRYWGEPIPVVHCEKDGVVPVPEDQLPVMLPELEHYEPTGTGESPLANITDWVNTTCPKCGGPAKRETDTMPQWAGSCWYYLRFMDPHNNTALVDTKREKAWAPVDLYVGGAEHATRHLIYARFWHKFLFDLGYVSTTEPFSELHSVGLILAEDGRKMSKRWGNVVNPDDIVHQFGADSLRVYEMFMGPFANAVAWSTNGLVGARRFIDRVWRLRTRIEDTTDDNELLIHQTIKKIGDDILAFKFNTAISQLMICLNGLEASKTVSRSTYELFLKLLAPFAPHVTEELWHRMGNKGSVHLEMWPNFDPSKLDSDSVTIAVQVSGKTRGTVSVKRGASQDEVLSAIRDVEKMAHNIPISPSKVIYIPNRVINVIP